MNRAVEFEFIFGKDVKIYSVSKTVQKITSFLMDKDIVYCVRHPFDCLPLNCFKR